MNIELAIQIAKERSQQWRDQAAIEREVSQRHPFKLANFLAPRRNKLSRKHA